MPRQLLAHMVTQMRLPSASASTSAAAQPPDHVPGETTMMAAATSRPAADREREGIWPVRPDGASWGQSELWRLKHCRASQLCHHVSQYSFEIQKSSQREKSPK